jgi:HAD superfamily hydrolase (TIGR01509 family)
MLTRLPVRAVLFDWDGTLLDSYRADASAYLQMFRALGINWGLADLAKHYCPDWYRVYRAADLPLERWPEADRLWRTFYRRERPMLLPGARQVIEKLSSRYPLGLVSSGSRLRVRTQLRAFALDTLFTTGVFGDEVPRRKPHPVQLEIAMRQLGFEPAACIYVGDTPEDVEMAQRAGVTVVGVLGHSPVPQRLRQARPDALIPRITSLPALFSPG